MKRLAANSCGYSGYICRGIPDIKYNGIYKTLFKDLILIPSALVSCGVYSQQADLLPYIWHNFGNLPTTVRIYDTDAGACLSLAVAGQNEKLLTCNIRYDRYSLEYFSVATKVGLQVPYVILNQCYVAGLDRLLHIPGILDPAHSTPDILIPLIKVPTKTPKIADIDVDVDVDTRALNLGMIAGGRFTNALQLSQLQACNSTLFKVTAVLADTSSAGSSFTYEVTVAAGAVLVLDDLDRSAVLTANVALYTTQVTVALGKSVTYYIYCRVDLGGSGISCKIEFRTDKRSRLLNSWSIAYVLIATVTIGCADRDAQDMLFKSIDASGTDTEAETTDVMTSAIALWNALLQSLLKSDKGRCAVSIIQHTCGKAKLLYSLLGVLNMLQDTLASLTIMGLTVACLSQSPRFLPMGPFNCTNTDASKGGIVQLLQLLGLPDSPTASSDTPHITNVGYMLNGILTVDGGKLVTVPSIDADLPKPPDDSGLYVLGYINGSTTWIPLVPGDAPTFPD